MSVKIDVERLEAEVGSFGDLAYCVTVGDGPAPHVVSVRPAWRGGEIVVGAGRRTGANVAARPSVTLLWPPAHDGGFSLLVDGEARVEGEEVVVRPLSAILHRSVAAADGSRASDCAELA